MKWTLLDVAKFSHYQEEWNELNKKSQNLAVLNSDFIEPLINEFFEGNECFVLGHDNNKLCVAGFLNKVGSFQWTTVMPSQAPVALWLCSGHKFNTHDVASLAKALPGLVLTIDFLQVDSRDLELNPRESFALAKYIETGNRPIPQDFDEYFKSLGKNMRQNYTKVINRAERAGDTLGFECLSTPEEVTLAVQKYGELESKGWKSEHGTAISPDNDQGRFYTDMLSRLAQKNQACCWYYKINQQIVAVDLCVMQQNTLIILKTTYDEEFSKQSPALQLKVEMIKHYSQAQTNIDNIEFYGRVMQWHTRLDSEVRELQHLSWFRSSLVRNIISTIKKLKP